jgi:hypothetical protein
MEENSCVSFTADDFRVARRADTWSRALRIRVKRGIMRCGG